MTNAKKPEKHQDKNSKQIHSGGCCQPNSYDKAKNSQQPPKKPQGK